MKRKEADPLSHTSRKKRKFVTKVDDATRSYLNEVLSTLNSVDSEELSDIIQNVVNELSANLGAIACDSSCSR